METNQEGGESWLLAVRSCGLVLYFAHLPVVTLMVLGSIDGPLSAMVLLIGTLIGYAMADLISGLVHWASDSFGHRSTRILGPLLVRPFRDHHVDATAITREPVIELHGANCFFSAPLLMTATYLVQPSPEAYGSILLLSVLWSLALGVLAAGQIHRWVHQDEAPQFVRYLQRIGLVISARDHNIHHGGEHTSHYCIVSGWWNRPLQRWNAFSRLENALARHFGVENTRDLD